MRQNRGCRSTPVGGAAPLSADRFTVTFFTDIYHACLPPTGNVSLGEHPGLRRLSSNGLTPMRRLSRPVSRENATRYKASEAEPLQCGHYSITCLIPLIFQLIKFNSSNALRTKRFCCILIPLHTDWLMYPLISGILFLYSFPSFSLLHRYFCAISRI